MLNILNIGMGVTTPTSRYQSEAFAINSSGLRLKISRPNNLRRINSFKQRSTYPALKISAGNQMDSSELSNYKEAKLSEDFYQNNDKILLKFGL